VTGSARPAGSATTWSLAEAQAWDAEDALGAAARTAELAAFPNPLRSETTIRYALAETAEVRLAVYDVLGRQVALLAEGRQEAGPHAATFDARGLATGTYVYRLQVGESVQTGRLTVVN
ncbi:MAG: T9SS type A sorting domain-containing protein, partial [Bacteroidota bacterium]